ncbi:MAG TPA: pitrilysin family protein [Solirubrobacteraceae bacterium]|nr:pitrilysin family protein [Solirubrobacteraceae bacterium]
MSTLDSGVRVVSERVPGVRSVALGVWIATGSVLEREQQAGISHLLEHMLFRGTERYGSREIDEIFDGLGAEINAGTDKETTSLYTRVLDRHLERAFDVVADMVWCPRFGELEAEREVVLEEIAMYEDDPQDRVFDVLGRAVFGEHPLGRPVIGSAQTVAAITRERLAAFHAERYRPDSIVIAAAGSLEHDALVRLVSEAERARDVEPPAAAGNGRAARTGPSPEPSAGAGAAPGAAAGPQFERRVRFLEKDTEQYHVCVGGPGIARADERRFALRVLEGVLGGTSSSRLFQEVRERRGLAYSVFTFSNLYAHAGEVGLYVGTRPENLSEAMSVIAAELERCVHDPASEQELVRSRENLKGRVVLGMESTGARMSRLGASVLGELPILSVNEMLERIDAVGIRDVRALAAELFAPGALSAAGVGPGEAEFRAAIAPLGWPERAEQDPRDAAPERPEDAAADADAAAGAAGAAR